MGCVSEIDAVLKQIEELLARIEPLRRKADTMTREMEEAQKEYEQFVDPANQEAARLEAAIALCRRRLSSAGLHSIPGPSEDPPPHPEITPPRPWDETPDRPAEEDPQVRQKRFVADHVLYFAAAEDDPIVIAMTAMLNDSACGAGEMLELIAWGDMWKVAPEWEPDTERLDRLRSWQLELEGRLEYWQSRVRQLTFDGRHGLAEQRRRLKPAEWTSNLEAIAREQEADNLRRLGELELLEAERNHREGGGAA